jgi:hypothetical protein
VSSRETVHVSNTRNVVLAIDKDWEGPFEIVWRAIESAVLGISEDARPVRVIYGDGKGAEGRIADRLRAAGVLVTQEKAKWAPGNKTAGKDRNNSVLTTFKPEAVLVFPSPSLEGRGNTASWSAAARNARIPIHNSSAASVVESVPAFTSSASSAPIHAPISGELDLNSLTADMFDDVVDDPPLAPSYPPSYPRPRSPKKQGQPQKAQKAKQQVQQEQEQEQVNDDDLFSAYGVTLSNNCIVDDSVVPPSSSLNSASAASAFVAASAVSSSTSSITLDAGAELLRTRGTVCVSNPPHHLALPGPDAPTATEDAGENNVDESDEENADEDNDDIGADADEAADEAEGAYANTNTNDDWKPLVKPRGEWLTPQEVRERFVDISVAQALVLARAQQGAATLKTRIAEPLAVPNVSDMVDVAIEPHADARAFCGKIVEVVLARGFATFFYVVDVQVSESDKSAKLRLRFSGWSRDVIPRAGCVFPTGCELKDESWIFGRMMACTGSVYGSAAGENEHEPPRRSDSSIKPGLLEKKVWELDDDPVERERFVRNVTFGSKNEPHARESFTLFCRDVWLRARYEGLGEERFLNARAQSRVLEFGVLAMPGEQSWMRSSPDGVFVFKDVDGTFRLLFVEYKCPANLHWTQWHPYRKYPCNTPPYYKSQIQGGMGLLNEAHNQPQWRRVLALTIEDEVAKIEATRSKSPDADGFAWISSAYADLKAALSEAHPSSSELSSESTRAASTTPNIDTRFDVTHFVVWQRHQLWITHAPYDDEYYRTFLMPRLRLWYSEFLEAMTHKFNGRLVRGETAPLAPDLVGERLDIEDPDAHTKLAERVRRNMEAAARVCDTSRAVPTLAWQARHVAGRFGALAQVFLSHGFEGGLRALDEFTREKDSTGRLKIDALRRSLPNIQREIDAMWQTISKKTTSQSESESPSESETNEDDEDEGKDEGKDEGTDESESETDEDENEDDAENVEESKSVLNAIVDALCVLLKRGDGSWCVEQLRFKNAQRALNATTIEKKGNQKDTEDKDIVLEWFVLDVERAVAAVFRQ